MSILVFQQFNDSFRMHSTSDEPLFHMMDVAKILMLPKTSRDVLAIVWAEYRFQMADGVGKPSWWVNKPGLYQMIFRSNHNKAVKFQRWVFEEILPSLEEKGVATAPLQNETIEQYKERESKLLALNTKLIEERDAAVEDCHQMAFESFAHICYDCFGITIDEYKHFLKFGYGFNYKKFPTISYEKLLTKIHKYFNRLVLMEHKPDFRTPAKQAEIIAKWNEKRPNKEKNERELKVTSRFQQKHDFLAFVIFLVDFEKNKLVKEGLINWTETVNLS